MRGRRKSCVIATVMFALFFCLESSAQATGSNREAITTQSVSANAKLTSATFRGLGFPIPLGSVGAFQAEALPVNDEHFGVWVSGFVVESSSTLTAEEWVYVGILLIQELGNGKNYRSEVGAFTLVKGGARSEDVARCLGKISLHLYQINAPVLSRIQEAYKQIISVYIDMHVFVCEAPRDPVDNSGTAD